MGGFPRIGELTGRTDPERADIIKDNISNKGHIGGDGGNSTKSRKALKVIFTQVQTIDGLCPNRTLTVGEPSSPKLKTRAERTGTGGTTRMTLRKVMITSSQVLKKSIAKIIVTVTMKVMITVMSTLAKLCSIGSRNQK